MLKIALKQKTSGLFNIKIKVRNYSRPFELEDFMKKNERKGCIWVTWLSKNKTYCPIFMMYKFYEGE